MQQRDTSKGDYNITILVLSDLILLTARVMPQNKTTSK